MVKLASSMLYVIASIWVENTLYIMIAIVEAVIPKAVLIKASEIPVASAEVSGEPCDIAANERIIPNTVPIKPINVAIDAHVDKTERFLDNIGNSNEVAS